MQLWRINLKPDSKEGVDAAEFCVSRGVVGIGWGIEENPTTKEEYWELAEPQFIENTRIAGRKQPTHFYMGCK